MENKFKVSKVDKYISLEYISYTPANHRIDWSFEKSQWFSNKDVARNFVNYICDVENSMVKYVEENNLDVNPFKVIRMWLKVLESICSGFDVRSDWTIDEVTERFINSYIKKRENAKNKCEAFIEMLKTTNATEYSRYQEIEEHDTLNLTYELGFPEMSTFCGKTLNSHLDDMLGDLDKILALIKDGKKKI